ncbi:MAG TPA: phosphate acyltransferase PlsX [Candidatus Acetothermia bacterium]|nr:phosphate acyltransferase PlsX [Candidatus Acetothermia bacterium]
MQILVDVMGGDQPPEELVRGGVEIGRLREMEICFAGDGRQIDHAIRSCGERPGRRFHILPCSQVISMQDAPVRSVREKSDSSMVRGLRELRNGTVAAFVSPGNTGAVVAASLLVLGRVRGIPRPAILAPIPTLAGQDLHLLDAGANADCHAEHLLHFARMGSAYAREVVGVDAPRVGLLNIGEEASKGSRLMIKSYTLLEAECPGFRGNIEPHEMLEQRPVDIVVSDGLIGNICLKSIEGGVSAVTGLLRRSIKSSAAAKLGALFMRSVFRDLRYTLSYRERGGAPLLGVNGVVVIAHGRSDAHAIRNAIDSARREVEAGLTECIARTVPPAEVADGI